MSREDNEELAPLPPGSTGWGLFDTKDENWLGTNKGPLVYSTEDAAALAARLMDARLDQPAGRTRARRYEVEANIKVEDMKPKYTAAEGFLRLESGKIL